VYTKLAKIDLPVFAMASSGIPLDTGALMSANLEGIFYGEYREL